MTSPDPTLTTDLEKLDGPCRAMDFRVREAAGCTWDEWDAGDGDTMITRHYPDGARIDLPNVTASIDAAVALAERVLPGCHVDVSTSGCTKHTEYHWSRDLDGHRLDYWPSRKKYQYRGKVRRGDVMEFIQHRALASKEGG